MAYKKIKLINLSEDAHIPAFKVLMSTLNVSMNEAQRLIDKKRVFCNDELITHKNAPLQGQIELIEYEAVPKGLKPLFENDEFAVFDKPSGVLSHPNGRNCEYSLYDELLHLWGKNACIAHRLDKDTSGLILVAKNQKVAKNLKKKFELRQIHKEYLALVKGQSPLEFSVSLPLALAGFKSKIKITPLNEGGKMARSEFKRLRYFKEQNATLVLCKPLTGRQHQLRIHLYASGFGIFGDTLYGLNEEQIENILDKKLNQKELVSLTGASRLCLHAHRLCFEYHGQKYDFISHKDMENELLKALV